MAAFQIVPTPELRKINIHRDLLPVADLIELCFGEHMDLDGKAYLRQIRRAAGFPFEIRTIKGCNELVTYPIYGYVWEEANQVVGNLTLIPSHAHGIWRYLIANVAVHPNHRNKGIGRALTEKGIQHIRDCGADAAWLQVRADNPIAIHLYESLGMVERVIRTTWESSRDSIMEKPIPQGIRVVNKQRQQDWPLQLEWLQTTYPPEVAWQLPFNPRKLEPSIWNKIINSFQYESYRHWTVFSGSEPVGFASWEGASRYADVLWLAFPPHVDPKIAEALLYTVCWSSQNSRPIHVNYPEGQLSTSFHAAGFFPVNTLIWMEMKFR